MPVKDVINLFDTLVTPSVILVPEIMGNQSQKIGWNNS